MENVSIILPVIQGVLFIGFLIAVIFLLDSLAMDRNRDKILIQKIVDWGEPFAIISYNGKYHEVDVLEDMEGEHYVRFDGKVAYLKCKKTLKISQ
jgi:hypothetical protein